MLVFIFQVLVIAVVFILTTKRPLLAYVILKTLKRDVTAVKRFIQTTFTLRYTKFFNQTVHQRFDITARRYPNKVCFYFEDQQWTFRQMQEMTNRIANYFQAQGFKKGYAIALYMENRPEYVCIWLGLAKIGAVPALINYNIRLKSLEHSLTAANCKALIYGQELTNNIQEILVDGKFGETRLYAFSDKDAPLISTAVDLVPELKNSSSESPIIKERVNFYDNLFYIYTSGTTGLPKAAVIKHGRYIMASAGSHYLQDVRTDDIIYTALPFYHSAAAMLGIGHALHFGTSIVFRKKFSASNFWKDCIRHNATVAQYIGELCRYLLTQPVQPEDKKHCVRLMYGNGLRANIWEEFVSRFNIPNISEFYGSTEGNCNLVNIDSTVGAVGFIPRALSFILNIHLIKVDRETGEIIRDPKTGLAIHCGPNEPGELVGVIKEGDPIKDFQGYADATSKGKKVVRDIFRKGDAAFRSGDLLVSDDFGYFYFKDRTGDTFRWKGENVSTAEVESVISRACGNKDAAVYGVEIPGTDGRAGMSAIADTGNSLDLESLQEAVSKELPAYARPMFLRVLNHIDMTGTYKMKKVELQKEGFDVTTIKDKLYFNSSGKYVPLDETLYKSIISGKTRV